MTPQQETQLLAYAANRAKAHPQYLAWVLARYIEREHLSEHELTTSLGISRPALAHLGLCLRPRADHFADDITQISAKFQIDPAALAMIVRLVESLETFPARTRREIAAESGLLMAARARKEPRPQQDNEERPHAQPEP